MMYLLFTESEVCGVFSTKEKAETAKKELVAQELPQWKTDSCGKDELLAEATPEELAAYNLGQLSIEEFECYPKIYNDWSNCYHIAPIELDKILIKDTITDKTYKGILITQ